MIRELPEIGQVRPESPVTMLRNTHPVRKKGAEWTLKIENARHLIVQLLNDDFIQKSEAVRLRFYALIHYATAETAVADRRARSSQSVQGNANDNDANDLMSQADQFLLKTLMHTPKNRISLSRPKIHLPSGSNSSILRSFFHYLDAASEIRHAAETFGA